MSKERRTVSIEPDVDEYLSREGVNASELVNELVKNHYSAGGDEKAMLKLREQQLESDVRSLEGQITEKEKELNQIRNRLLEFEDQTETILKEAADVLVTTDPENEALKTWARKADLSPERFAERLEKHLEE